nr:unnamed protein product [Spirometra erinaceieuropaei]
MTADAQQPHAQPQSIAAISIIINTNSTTTTTTTTITTAPILATDQNPPDGPPTTALTTTLRGVGSVLTCRNRDDTFASPNDLIGHLRTHRTAKGTSVPGPPTHIPRIRLHCPRTFIRRMGLCGHMRIHNGGIRCCIDARTTSCTPTNPPPYPQLNQLLNDQRTHH